MLRPPRASTVAAAAHCALVAGACSPGPAEDGGRTWNLLSRSPDRVLRQPGKLVPDPRLQWGEHGREGWNQRTHRAASDRPFVWSHARAAQLVLPAGERRERLLEITGHVPPPTVECESVDAVVRINDVTVGRIELRSASRTSAIETPRDVWIEGDNLLEIEVACMRRLPGSDTGPSMGLALSEVAYGEPNEPDVVPDEGRLELRSYTGASYLLEGTEGASLRLGAEASGSGAVQVDVARLDPATGEELEIATEFRREVAAGPIDWRLPLPDAGESVLELRLAWRAAGDASLRVTELGARAPEAADPPPILVVAIDTLSARHLSNYGYARETTPNLDALAASGVVFESCVTNAPWTLPSFMAMMTGLYGKAHELKKRRAPARELWERMALAQSRYTLAEALRAAGYDTAGFIDHDFLTGRFGFEQGFELYDTSAAAIHNEDYTGGVSHVTARALEWLDARTSDAPPFLFLHCFDVHGPYLGDDTCYAGDAHASDRIVRTGGASNTYGIVPLYITRGMYEKEQLPPRLAAGDIVAAYDEGLAFTDAELGRFFDELKERGLYDEMLIVVTADHGETMAQKDFLFGHGVLEDAVLRVPLIVKLPHGEHGGRRVTSWVQLVDLFPTLLDVAGIDQPPYVHGRSLLPELAGEHRDPRPLLTEDGIMEQAALHYDGWKLKVEFPGTMARDSGLLSHPMLATEWLEKRFPEILETGMTQETYARIRERPDYADLVRSLRDSVPARIELYHVSDDPLELDNVAGEERERLYALTKLLLAEIERREEARAMARDRAAPAPLPDDAVEALRAIGYGGD